MPLKPNTFRVSFPEVIMIAKVFTSQKHEISEKAQKSVGGCSKNEKRCNATSQMRWRFIYRRVHTFPAMYKLLTQKNTIKHNFQSDAHRLAIHITSGHRNNNFFL